MDCNARAALMEQFEDLEKQIFASELASLEYRMSCCNYWLDWARLQGDKVSLAKLTKLLDALRLHRQYCRDILVRLHAQPFPTTIFIRL